VLPVTPWVIVSPKGNNGCKFNAFLELKKQKGGKIMQSIRIPNESPLKKHLLLGYNGNIFLTSRILAETFSCLN
jgi:hypothetical protein